MRGEALRGALAVFCLLLVASGTAAGQFTQGPPGNPSAAGISSGSPPPAPTLPSAVTPPRSSGAAAAVGPQQYTPDAEGYDASDGMLSGEGVPPILAVYPGSPLARYLRLSSEQLDGIGALRNRLYRDTRDLRYDLAKKILDMRRLFADPHADNAVLFSVHKEILSLREKLADGAARTAIEARRLLKGEQVEALDHLPGRPTWQG